MDDRVELGIKLLTHIEDHEMSVADVIDRLELITTDPRITRKILQEAEQRDIISRDNTTVRSQTSAHIQFNDDVIVKEGEFTCQRCGATLQTGHFINFDGQELGAFGSTCIRKVIGRD
ncbi:MAG: DUF5830 family protein [Halobacteriaceae archaeon]